MQKKIKLKSNALEIINSKFAKIQACVHLKNTLIEANPNSLSDANEEITKNGMALSSFHAVDCIDDHLRTTQFLKGIYAAIKQLSRIKGSINILYVGPGPFGTLLTPLLPLFDIAIFERIDFVEINNQSSIHLQQTLSNLGFTSNDIFHVLNEDITSTSPTVLYDLVICETMHRALEREPQVALTKHLEKFLSRDGIFIPQEVNLCFGYSKLEKEPSFINKISDYPLRNSLETLWTLKIPFEPYQAKWKSLNSAINKGDELNVFTSIKVYDDYIIDSGQSLITDPICIFSDFKNKSDFRLEYIQERLPHWKIEFK